MLANDHDRLRGSDVVARFPLGFIRDGAEIFLDKLFSARQTERPHMNTIMADSRSDQLVRRINCYSDWREIQAAFLAFTFAHLARWAAAILRRAEADMVRLPGFGAVFCPFTFAHRAR